MKKILFQLATSTLALYGLLGAVAAQATSLAELPLKASVLAKPNVVFGMDDSGSMDWEMLLDTDSGVAWWDGANSAWNTVTGRPLESSAFVPMVYLFPVGTAEGGQIYPFNAWYGQIAPPINQLAWLRSNRFNPLYYNPATRYPRWADANMGGAGNRTFTNATAIAARSHPATTTSPTLNMTVTWDQTNGNFTNTGGAYRFYVQQGMILPAGTVVNATTTSSGACNGNTSRTLIADVTVANGSACWASIPYFPATYWEAVTACAAGPNCVLGPDGTTWLQRQEIRPANYTDPAVYAEQIQNFANWFSFYRKRKLMLAGSMGRALETVTGMRMNVVPFGERPALTEMFDADSTVNTKNRFAISGRFYLNSMVARGTPTHETMLHIGNEIGTKRYSASESTKEVVQYACQRNAMFVVTDGFANTPGSISVPSISSSALSAYGSSSPYTTTYDDSLAEIALAYYANPLRGDLTSGQVPTAEVDPTKPNSDQNPNLHINTYAISLGVRGTIWPRQFPQSAEYPGSKDPFTNAPNWPQPVGDDPTMLDDLYHATINGRGQMYLADNVTRLSQAIQSAFDDILAQNATQGGSSISSVNLDNTEGSAAYAGGYDPAGWTGDVTKAAINRNTGAVATTTDWSAASLLNARTAARNIVAGNGTSGGTIFDTSVASIVNPGAIYGTDADVMAYLRGDRSLENTVFRRRKSLMGPVVNAVPAFDRETKMVYVASGEGMLHAFDSNTGNEEWAYVPYDTLGAIGATSQRAYVYQTKLDASVTIGKAGSGKLLVGGMGAAGRSYYAIDVTSPKGLTEAGVKDNVRWTFPRAGDTTNRGLMGFTVGAPLIVKTVDGKQVVLVTSGYDNGQSVGDGKGRVWALDASTGLPTDVGPSDSGVFVTPEGSAGAEAGLAHLSAFLEADGTVRYAYGGDLLGNVWRFDLKKGSSQPVMKLAQLNDGSKVQPVTAAPALVRYLGKRVVMVGTGRLLDVADFGTSDGQSFYAISDTDTTVGNVRTDLVRHFYARGNNPEVTGASVNWTSKRGWYFDLPAGEKANTRPVVGFTTVGFATNKNGGNDCKASSYLYVIDITTGLMSPDVGYASTVISNGANSTGATNVKLRDGSLRLVGQVYEQKKGEEDPTPPSGKKCSKLGLDWICKGEDGRALPPSRNSWREVVR